jgi:hypothetical protein
MEGRRDGTSESGREVNPSFDGRDVSRLVLLLALAASIHIWLIWHTEVTARDGVGFMRYAWQLGAQGWPEVLRENHHPPLYPLTILAVSRAVRWHASGLTTGNACATMQLSAQLASALAGTLLVVPIYFLGRRFFDRRVGSWAAVLFQCLPASSRVLGDALSEGVFLLLNATALVCALRAFDSRRPLWFALCGFLGGLAYLARPEGTLGLAAMGLVLLGMQAVPAWRWPWRRTVTCGACLALAAMAVGLPYSWVIHGFTNKTTAIEVLQTAEATEPHLLPSEMPADRLVAAYPLALYGPGSKELHFFRRHLWCLAAVAKEIVKGYHYVGWLPAVIGLYWFRDRFRTPGAMVLAVLMLMHILAVWRVAYVVGYVAERHILLLVMGTSFWSVAAVLGCGEWLGAIAQRWAVRRAGMGHRLPYSLLVNGRVVPLVLVIGLAVSGLPKTLEPLHSNRAGYHAAGLWLAEHAQPGETILDPFCWVEYYAGQVFYQIDHRSAPQPPRFVVLGGTLNEHRRLPLLPAAKHWAASGRLVYQWDGEALKNKAEEVRVYEIPRAPPKP